MAPARRPSRAEGGTANVCWSPPLGDAGITVDISQAMAIALGTSDKMYAVDSAGNFRQAIYGMTSIGCGTSDCGTLPGGVIYFARRVATSSGTIFSVRSGVKGVNTQGNLVLENASVFSPSSGNTQSLAPAGSVSSVSGDYVSSRMPASSSIRSTDTAHLRHKHPPT